MTEDNGYAMLTTMGILLGTAAAAALGKAHWNRKLALDSLDDMRKAIDAGKQLLALAAHLQQHRGMSTAWLSGDASYAPRLTAKRADILACIAALHEPVVRETDRPYPCFTHNDVALFRFKWQTLVDDLPGLSPELSIGQHTQLIAVVLDWLASFGEARIELPAGELVAAGTTRNVCHRLPALAETLGQARALGMGVAASAACKPVARVRLMFLTTRAESLLQQSMAFTGPGTSADMARMAVEEMIKVIRCDMLGAQNINVATNDYYLVATTAIDAVYGWIGACVADLIAQLEAAKIRSVVMPLRRDEDNTAGPPS